MAKIRASGAIQVCQHVNMELEVDVISTGSDETGVVRCSKFHCPDCGKDFHIIGDDGMPRPFAQVNLASRLPDPPSKNGNDRKKLVATSFSSLVAEWVSAGGKRPPPEIAPDMVYVLTTLKKKASLLMIGAAGGLLPFVANKRGADHLLISDDGPAISSLSETCANVELRPSSWKPEYGRLFTGVIVSELLTDDQIQWLPSVLQPGGDCWLIGDARIHAPELSQKWGYQPRTLWAEGPGMTLYFYPDDEPLGEGPGTVLSEELEALKMRQCQQCRSLARKMNAWGSDGCREHLDEIVDDMFPRAVMWWENTGLRTKMSTWWNSNGRLKSAMSGSMNLATGERDELLKGVIRDQVLSAIGKNEKEQSWPYEPAAGV